MQKLGIDDKVTATDQALLTWGTLAVRSSSTSKHLSSGIQNC